MGRMIEIEGAESVPGYLVAPPSGVEPRGGLVVIHEAWGLVDHIKDVADRFAAEGWVVLAPDLLSRVGVRPTLADELQSALFDPDPAVRAEAQPRLREAMSPVRSPEFGAQTVAALKAVVDTLARQPGVERRIGVVGFCFGGTYAFALAAEDPRITAAVPFYGAPPEGTALAGIHAPVLAFYGETDERLTAPLPEVTAALLDAGVDFEAQVYPGVGHAFFNDTNRYTYDAGAAGDAWHRTLDFLAGKR